ncbi:MAG: hypothetical protein FP816_12225 [Desulfobacteraceae bacterium]|nr:hypothetical protein [Desulfobacteraceae bacterium]
MADSKNNLYLMDKRFLMGFLLEESEEQAKALRKTSSLPSRAELTVFFEKFKGVAPDLTGLFLSTAQSILPHVVEEEFHLWVDLGAGLLDPGLVSAFFSSSLAVLTRTPFTYFKGWVEKGAEMAGVSHDAAVTYFALSRSFIEYSNNIQLRKWGDWALHLQTRGGPENTLGTLFLHHSITCLKFMTFREFREYKELGFLFFRQDWGLGAKFFSGDAEGLGKLEVTQRRDLYRLTRLIARNSMEEAFAFFTRYPEQLSRVVAIERNRALQIIETLSRSHPEKLEGIFDHMVQALEFRAYPLQLMILNACERIAESSEDAAEAFVFNVGKVLDEIPESFLSEFVEEGLLQNPSGSNAQVSFFSLASGKSQESLARWRSAVLLEDHQQALTLLAEAMTGKTLSIETSRVGTDGKTIYLPSHMVQGFDRQENFERYKIATAHQAGCMEFKTFDSGLSGMMGILGSLSQKDLALDLFSILEHGRIDDELAGYYGGLKKMLIPGVFHEMEKRPGLETLPLQEALVEAVLYYSVAGFHPGFQNLLENPPDFFSPHKDWMSSALTGFYEKAKTVTHCLEKALELYRVIQALLNQNPNRMITPYEKSIPLEYRGVFHPDMAVESHRNEPPTLNQASPEPRADQPGEVSGPGEKEADPDFIKLRQGRALSGTGSYLDRDKKLEFTTQGESLEDEGSSTPFESGPGFTVESSLAKEGVWLYDEWDYLQKTYRKQWCRLFERPQEESSSEKIHDIYVRNRQLIQKAKRQFEQLKPSVFNIIPRVDWGDELDLSAVVEGRVDKKAGNPPSDRIFFRKEKKIQSLSVLFLMDMSASTGSPVCPGPETRQDPSLSGQPSDFFSGRKIMDVEIESLVVVMEALETLSHPHAIYGFSGQGRHEVEMYAIKDFSEPGSELIKRRMAGMKPRKSTRMGPAIRHAVTKLGKADSEQRLMILLSDGFPQDFDYGEDRSSYEYGIHDTMMALLEAKYQGIQTFCITVDPGGKDYLQKMCDPGAYLALQNIHSLPEMLPKVLASLIH